MTSNYYNYTLCETRIHFQSFSTTTIVLQTFAVSSPETRHGLVRRPSGPGSWPYVLLCEHACSTLGTIPFMSRHAPWAFGKINYSQIVPLYRNVWRCVSERKCMFYFIVRRLYGTYGWGMSLQRECLIIFGYYSLLMKGFLFHRRTC